MTPARRRTHRTPGPNITPQRHADLAAWWEHRQAWADYEAANERARVEYAVNPSMFDRRGVKAGGR